MSKSEYKYIPIYCFIPGSQNNIFNDKQVTDYYSWKSTCNWNTHLPRNISSIGLQRILGEIKNNLFSSETS